MSDQFYRIDNKAVPIDEMVAAGKLLTALMESNVLVPVKLDYAAAVRERDRQLMTGVLNATAIVDVAYEGAD